MYIYIFICIYVFIYDSVVMIGVEGSTVVVRREISCDSARCWNLISKKLRATSSRSLFVLFRPRLRVPAYVHEDLWFGFSACFPSDKVPQPKHVRLGHFVLTN